MEKRVDTTLFIGKNYIEYEQLDSTQLELERLIENQNLAEGTVVTCKHQFNGKGLAENTWSSEAGKNITMSLLLKPKTILIKEQFIISQIIALSIYDFLKEISIENIQIKWPNDILINEKKVAGVIIKNSVSQQKIHQSIIGIGINVNQSQFDDELKNATSIYIQQNQFYNIFELQSSLLQKIEQYYLKIKGGERKKIQEEYVNKLFKYKEFSLFYDNINKNEFIGKIMGTDDIGRLVLMSNNELKYFQMKEIKYL